jgi:hypothetical protein
MNLGNEPASIAITDYKRLSYMGYVETKFSKNKIYTCRETAYKKHLCGISSVDEISVQPSQEMTKDDYKLGKLVPNQKDRFFMEIARSNYYCVIVGENTMHHTISMHFRHSNGEIPAHYYPLIRFHTLLLALYCILTTVFVAGILRFHSDVFLVQVSQISKYTRVIWSQMARIMQKLSVVVLFINIVENGSSAIVLSQWNASGMLRKTIY